MKRLHIINRVDFKNAGDFACSIYGYFLFYNFKVIHHDIDDIFWSFIRKDDVVIIGSGGVLNVTESFNKNIIRITESCDNVIGWGIGFNRTKKDEPVTDIIPYLDRFKLIGIRDYNHPTGLEYLPCPSVFLLEHLDQKKELREVGVLNHRDYRIKGLDQYESIENSCSIWEMIDFIQTSKVIITSSYHGVYFTQLLGKKVCLDNVFSEKFNYFRHKPYIGVDTTKAKNTPSDYMKECIDLNNEFYKKVCSILNIDPVEGNRDIANYFDIQTRIANLSWRIRTLENKVSK